MIIQFSDSRFECKLLEEMGKGIKEPRYQAEQYGVEYAQRVMDIAIRRNDSFPLSHNSGVALALGGYSATRTHRDRNANELDVRSANHKDAQETSNNFLWPRVSRREIVVEVFIN